MSDEVEKRVLENLVAEQGAVLEWVAAAVRGEEVSDFGGSFSLVREVLDLKRERDVLQAELLNAEEKVEVMKESVSFLESCLKNVRARPAAGRPGVLRRTRIDDESS